MRFPAHRMLGTAHWLYLLIALTVKCSNTTGLNAADHPPTDCIYDVVIYGGTSAGIAAAIQVKQMGKSVLLIEPTGHLGGLTTGGLGQTDIGNKAAIGGIAREFYRRVREHYSKAENWKWQSAAEYRSAGQSRTDPHEETMWTFEPSAASKIFRSWLAELNVPLAMQQRLERPGGAMKTRSIPWRVIALRMESGQTYRGRMFIDATYEGDLLAAAGVQYTLGRESNQQYGETINGVQTTEAVYHQFVQGVDPYCVAGDSSSGLLPFIEPAPPEPDGTADHRVQAYCFRMCMTDHPDNRIPWKKPSNYQAQWYELLLRNFDAGERRVPLSIGLMPNRKTDTNNNFGFSTDFIGQNFDYAEASYQQRDAIILQHRQYQQGLMWTLANHPRIPEHVRQEVSRWGLCRDEFTASEGWQDQLYIREARRMVGDLVMTQHHCQGRELAEHPVGLAAYTMDSHHVRRYVDSQGFVKNEGDVQVGGFSPFGIGYRSIVPKSDQCSNMLVPVCLSASHIAYGSIRMEPVFMVLAQAAATAAVQALDQDVAVQQIDQAQLKQRLLADRMILAWTGPPAKPVPEGISRELLPGTVMDETSAKRLGFSHFGRSAATFVGAGYHHDDNRDKGHQEAIYPLSVAESGNYEILISYAPHPNRATNVPVLIKHAEGESRVIVNQRQRPNVDNLFFSLGTYPLNTTGDQFVKISNHETDGYVIIDAVQLLK